MQFHTPQIVWHDNVAPIYSVDFQQNVIPVGSTDVRFATGGRDSNIRVWMLRSKQKPDGSGNDHQIEYRATLSRHERTVNVVRFSKRGDLLASGSDDCTIVIWQQSGSDNIATRLEEVVEKSKPVKRPVVLFNDDSNSFFEPERDQLEKWQAIRVLRAHVEDVYDLGWYTSPSASKAAEVENEADELLLSGSMDGSTILWHARAGRKVCNVKNHDGYVQGVAIDPRGSIAASISSDRSLLLYRLLQSNRDGSVELSEKFERVAKALLPKVTSSSADGTDCTSDHPSEAPVPSVPSSASTRAKVEKRVVKLFHDDSWKSFFRRLTFSPDGELLVVPSGVYPTERRVRLRTQTSANAPASASEFVTEMVDSHVCYVLSRTNNFAIPFALLPTDGRPAIAVRFCPLPFALRAATGTTDAKRATSLLPNANHRWLFAVLTSDSVLFYDTEQTEPFAYAADLHYGTLNDVAWCVSLTDGVVHVLVCSTDGYCSTIVFTFDELGRPISPDNQQTAEPRSCSEREQQLPASVEVPKPANIELSQTAQPLNNPARMSVDGDVNQLAQSNALDIANPQAEPVAALVPSDRSGQLNNDLNESITAIPTAPTVNEPTTPSSIGEPKKRRIALTTITKPDAV